MRNIRGTFMALGTGVALVALAACGGGETGQQTEAQPETPAAQTQPETGGMGEMGQDTMKADTTMGGMQHDTTMKADTTKQEM